MPYTSVSSNQAGCEIAGSVDSDQHNSTAFLNDTESDDIFYDTLESIPEDTVSKEYHEISVNEYPQNKKTGFSKKGLLVGFIIGLAKLTESTNGSTGQQYRLPNGYLNLYNQSNARGYCRLDPLGNGRECWLKDFICTHGSNYETKAYYVDKHGTGRWLKLIFKNWLKPANCSLNKAISVNLIF